MTLDSRKIVTSTRTMPLRSTRQKLVDFYNSHLSDDVLTV